MAIDHIDDLRMARAPLGAVPPGLVPSVGSVAGTPATLGARVLRFAPPGSAGRRRVNLKGVWLDQVDMPGAVWRIRRFLQEPGCHQVVTVNLDFLTMAERNSKFRAIINEADLAVADGMPLVWASRLKRKALAERVTGVELVAESCRVAAETGRSVFLLGGRPGVADSAARTLEARYPGLSVAGAYSPPVGPLTPVEDRRILEMIERAAPGFVFVALGAPRQDVWIRAHRGRLNASVAIGVGCVLDLLAGVVRRAPSWMQRSGLEWAYRLGQEPGRLWQRYLVNDLPTFGRLMLAPASEAVEAEWMDIPGASEAVTGGERLAPAA